MRTVRANSLVQAAGIHKNAVLDNMLCFLSKRPCNCIINSAKKMAGQQA